MTGRSSATGPAASCRARSMSCPKTRCSVGRPVRGRAASDHAVVAADQPSAAGNQHGAASEVSEAGAAEASRHTGEGRYTKIRIVIEQ
jgi:hypothetical protein